MYTAEEERDLGNDWHVSLTSAVHEAFEQILKERISGVVELNEKRDKMHTDFPAVDCAG